MARHSSKPQAAPPPDPTREQMYMAWRHYATPRWPPFEAAILSPLHRPAIVALARRMHRPAWIPDPARVTSGLPRGAYVPPTPTVEPLPTVPRRKPYIPAPAPAFLHRARVGTHDAKRAAANDREDD